MTPSHRECELLKYHIFDNVLDQAHKPITELQMLLISFENDTAALGNQEHVSQLPHCVRHGILVQYYKSIHLQNMNIYPAYGSYQSPLS